MTQWTTNHLILLMNWTYVTERKDLFVWFLIYVDDIENWCPKKVYFQSKVNIIKTVTYDENDVSRPCLRIFCRSLQNLAICWVKCQKMSTKWRGGVHECDILSGMILGIYLNNNTINTQICTLLYVHNVSFEFVFSFLASRDWWVRSNREKKPRLWAFLGHWSVVVQCNFWVGDLYDLEDTLHC